MVPTIWRIEKCTTPEFGGVDEVEFSVVLCVYVLCVSVCLCVCVLTSHLT